MLDMAQLVTRLDDHLLAEVDELVSAGVDEGLNVECAASFDNLQRIRRSALIERIGFLGPRRDEICTSLRSLADC